MTTSGDGKLLAAVATLVALLIMFLILITRCCDVYTDVVFVPIVIFAVLMVCVLV